VNRRSRPNRRPVDTHTAGSNRPVFSDPKEELGATQQVVRESNRRFRDDEFLLPRSVTAGRSAIRVRVAFLPIERPLFPGDRQPELAWSELGDAAYSFVVPDFAFRTTGFQPVVPSHCRRERAGEFRDCTPTCGKTR
jgi:hypothetical protein